MNIKTFVRIVVFAAIFAWPAVESYRYYVVRKELVASEQRVQAMSRQVAAVKAKHAQYAKAPAAAPK